MLTQRWAYPHRSTWHLNPDIISGFRFFISWSTVEIQLRWLSWIKFITRLLLEVILNDTSYVNDFSFSITINFLIKKSDEKLAFIKLQTLYLLETQSFLPSYRSMAFARLIKQLASSACFTKICETTDITLFNKLLDCLQTHSSLFLAAQEARGIIKQPVIMMIHSIIAPTTSDQELSTFLPLDSWLSVFEWKYGRLVTATFLIALHSLPSIADNCYCREGRPVQFFRGVQA